MLKLVLKVEYKCKNWIGLAEDVAQYRAAADTAVHLGFATKCLEFIDKQSDRQLLKKSAQYVVSRANTANMAKTRTLGLMSEVTYTERISTKTRYLSKF